MPEPMSTLKKSESITQKCEDLKENKQKQQSSNTDKTAGKGEEMQSSRSEDKTLAPKAEVQTSYLNNRDVNETLSQVSSENIIINNTIQETTKVYGQEEEEEDESGMKAMRKETDNKFANMEAEFEAGRSKLAALRARIRRAREMAGASSEADAAADGARLN
eukprot:TRINITY_DN50920_c0_g1_i1.p1 TRINITY_DN50920_c0_g1~~TRINITY_DN50920_c0_g1_i1.p1  ORF type:complete len:184 (-),score=65.48 TRINITY_DN50920_c0_g1_i1:41-526(-)